MNYLAHLYLADGDDGLCIGGFLADFVKGPLYGKYPEDIEQGMRLHRKIDLWSDQHPAISELRHLIPKDFQRYSGIVADILGDHFLSLEWNAHHRESLGEFSMRQLALLNAQKGRFPEPAKLVLARMSEYQWLLNYHRLEYCMGALDRIGMRFKQPVPLGKLIEPISNNYSNFNQLCGEILCDLKTNVAEWRALNQESTN
jgi:acyl carrier protein phosphodiesterase